MDREAAREAARKETTLSMGNNNQQHGATVT